MNNKIKIAIVGYGNIGKRHATHIIANTYTELCGICDIKADAVDTVPPNVPYFTSLSKMLDSAEIDVLSVCTPNYLHEAHTIAGLAAHKHVIVEKPMALSTSECDNMIAEASRVGKIIFAVKQNRYNPPVKEVKNILSNGGLGKIFLVQVNCFWNRSDAYYVGSDWRGSMTKDGGCLFTQFSHFIDIMFYLNGSIKLASGLISNFAHTHNTEIEDSGSFIMEAENGSIVNYNFTTCAYERNMEGSITIFGEKGTVKIGGQYLNTIEYQQVKGLVLPEINISAKSNDYGLYQGSMSNHDKMIQNVVDVLHNLKPITTTAEEGREVVKIIETMYKSAKRL